MVFYFPDISAYEPNSRVKEILKKSHGVIGLKVGYGTLEDPKWKTFRRDAQAGKAKVVLCYHFGVKAGRSHGASVQTNAEWFVRKVGKLLPGEVPVLDVESAGGSWSKADCLRWMDYVHSKLGGPAPMLYGNQSYIVEHGLASLMTTTKGWAAKYGNPGRTTSAPSIKWLVWQYAADGNGSPRLSWPGTDYTTDNNQVWVSPEEFYKRALSGKPVVDLIKTPKPIIVPDGDPVLRIDTEGKEQERLQEALNAVRSKLKISKLEEDGDFGDLTRLAVIALQRLAGIEDDGEYGKDSAKALRALVGA